MVGGEESYEMGRAVTVTADGSIILTGQIADNENPERRAIRGFDIWAVKLSRHAEILWQTRIVNPGWELGTSIVQTRDGGCLIVGVTSPNRQDLHLLNNCCFEGEADVVMVKLDEHGALLWQKVFGRSGADYGSAVVETDRGHLVLSGVSEFGTSSPSPFIVSFDADGTLLWQRSLDVRVSDVSEIVQAGDGSFILAGSGVRSFGYWDSQRAFVLRLDDRGEPIWHLRLRGGGGHTGLLTSVGPIAELEGGDIMVAGSHSAVIGGPWIGRISAAGELLSSNPTSGMEVIELNHGTSGISLVGTRESEEDTDLWTAIVEPDSARMEQAQILEFVTEPGLWGMQPIGSMVTGGEGELVVVSYLEPTFGDIMVRRIDARSGLPTSCGETDRDTILGLGDSFGISEDGREPIGTADPGFIVQEWGGRTVDTMASCTLTCP
jgi:hypothetical protein